MRFVGRDDEMRLLDRIYSKENVKTCMIYGRRRIGKTMMLRRFVEDKPHIYIEFDKNATETVHLSVIASELSDFLGKEVSFPTFRHAMKAIEDVCKEKKIVVVFDELPYLTKSCPHAASEIQHLTDHLVRDTESMIILCGSSISLMLEEVSRSDNPLYGRFMFQIRLGPLTLRQTREIHRSMTDEDILKTYLVLGGISAYHDSIGDIDFKSAVEDHFLNRFGFLRNDVRNWISEEMREFSDYAVSILDAISTGNNTYGSIQSATGLNEYSMNGCLERMMEVGLIEKRDSMIKSKKSKMYVISDRPTAFYYAVIYRNKSILDNSSGGNYDSMRAIISTHLGRMFEGYCRELVKNSYPCSEIGSWWGDIPFRDEYGNIKREENGKIVTEQTDVDVVATIRNGNERITLFGECKFTIAPTGFGALNTLKGRASYISPGANPRYALFSLSGFMDELIEYAENDGTIMLIGLDELVEKNPMPKI